MNKLDEYERKYREALQRTTEKREAQRLPSSSVSGGTESRNDGLIYHTPAKQESYFTTVKPKSARQRLLEVNSLSDKWYSGDTPTTSEALAQIYQIAKMDKERANSLYERFNNLRNDPANKAFYDPYTQATNRNIAAIAAYGIDVSNGIDDKWFEDNAWLKNHFRYGSSDNPLGTAKKATWQQNAASIYNDLWNAEQNTKKAETEWQALQDEVKYWANRKDLNLSDEEILNRIDWSNYKELQKMDASIEEGTPISYNRAIGYNRDNLYGVLWEARNGSDSTNTASDAIRYRLGQGEIYQEDADIRKRHDATSEYYDPYWTGIASRNMDDTALYFGVQDFGKDWLEQNRYILNSNDETAIRNYQRVAAAEETTLKAEEELGILKDRIDSYFKLNIFDPKAILDGILDADDINDEPALTTLKKIDESLKDGKLIDTTRAIQYSYNDLKREAEKRCEEEIAKRSGDQFAKDISQKYNYKTPTVAQVTSDPNRQHEKSVPVRTSSSAVNDAKNRNIRDNAHAIRDNGTQEEKIVYQTAGSYTYDQDVIDTNTTLQNETVSPQYAVDAAKESAMKYAGQNYMNARASLNERDKKQTQRNDILTQLAELAGFSGYKGNIDITNRVPVVNEDGSVSTVDSIGIGVDIDGQEKQVLIPTIVDGQRLSEEEAIQHFEQTGEHLGIFDTVDEANEYAERLHDQQEQMYAPQTGAIDRSRIIGPVAAGSPQEQPMSMPEEAKAEREKREAQIRLRNQLEQLDNDLKDGEENYKNAEDQIAASREMYQDYVDMARMNNWEVVDEDEFFSGFDILAQVLNNPVTLEQNLYSIYDEALESGQFDMAQILQIAQASLEEMETVKSDLEAAARRSNPFIEIPSKEQAANYNMTIEDLDQAIRGAKYFLLRGNEDFEAKAGNILAAIEKGMEKGTYADKKYTALSEYMTDEEKMTYAYILATEKGKAADEYLDYLADDTYGVITNRKAKQRNEERTAYAQENTGLANVLSIALSPVKALGGIYGFYQSMHGRAINTNSKWMQANTYSQIVKGTTHEKINEAYGEDSTAGKVLNFMYDVGTSVAESAVNGVLSPHLQFAKEGSFLIDLGLKLVSSVAGASIMGLGAAGDKMQEVLDNGGTQDQAAAMGFVTLVSETVSEGFSIGNISDAFDRAAQAGGRAGVEIILDLLKSGFEEGSEEVFGELFSTWQEDEIMGELSERNQMYEEYRVQLEADGMTDREEIDRKARELTDRAMLKKLSESFLSGALAGVIGPAAAELGGTAYSGAIETVNNIREEQSYNRSRQIVNDQISQRQAAAQQANTAYEEQRRAYEERTAPELRTIDRLNAEMAKAEQQSQQAEQAVAEAENAAQEARKAADEARTKAKEKGASAEEKARLNEEAKTLEKEAKAQDKAAAKARKQAEAAKARLDEKAEAYRAANEEAERFNQMERDVESARIAAEDAAKAEQEMRDFAQAQEDVRNEGKALKEAQKRTKAAEEKAKKARERAEKKSGTLEEQKRAQDEADMAEQEAAKAREEEEKHRANQQRAQDIIDRKYGNLAAEYMAQEMAATEGAEQAAAAEAPVVTMEDIRDQARSHVNRYGVEVNDAEARRVTNDVTALNEAMGGDYGQTAQTTATAAVLADSAPGTMGSTAAQHMMAEFGADKVLPAMKKILNNAVNRAGAKLQDVKMAITTAALNVKGNAHAILTNMMNGKVTVEGINALLQAAQEEAADPQVADEMWAQEKENRISRRAEQIAGDTVQADVESIKKDITDLEQKEENAQNNLSSLNDGYRKVLQTIADLTYRAMELSREGKSDESENVGNERRNAYNERKGLIAQIEKATQAVMNVQDNIREAQRKLKETQDRNNQKFREQAIAEINAEDAAAAQALAEQQAAEQAVMATAEQAAAEQAVQEGNTAEETTINPQEETAEQPEGMEIEVQAEPEGPHISAYRDTGSTETTTTAQPATEEEVVSGERAMRDLEDALGIKGEYRMSKYIRKLRNKTKGYTMNNGVIHTKDIQDAKTAMHEIGHNLDKQLGMKQWVQDWDALAKNYAEKVNKYFLAQYKPYERSGELMSEFVRIWAQDRKQAVDLAGNDFVNKFESSLRDKGWLEPMQKAAQQIRAWETAGNMAKTEAMIDLDVKKHQDKITANKLRSMIADRTLILQDLTDANQKLFGKVRESEDARTLLLAMPSMVANLTEANLYDEMTDPYGNAVLNKNGEKYGSLADILNNIQKSEEKAWNGYLLARLDIERKKVGKGLFAADVDSKKAVADYERKYSHFKKTAESLYDWYNGFVQAWLVDTGIKTQEEFDLMRSLYPSYVPLHAAEGNSSMIAGQKHTDGNPADVMKGAYESDVDKYNPVMGLIENVQKYIAASKKIEALRAFNNQMEAAMSGGADLGFLAEPAQKDMKAVNYKGANERAERAVGEALAQLAERGQIDDVAAEAILEQIEELPDMGFTPSSTATGNDVINIPMEDGTIKSWTIYNPELFKALTMMQPGGGRNALYRAFAGLTRFLSANATSRSLKFSGQNVFSDTETAANTGKTGYDGDLFMDIASGLRPVHAVKELRSMFELLGNMMAETALGKKMGMTTSEKYELFKKFGMPGSRYAFRNGKSQQEIRNSMYSGKGTIGKKNPMNVVNAFFKPIEFLGELGENATRMNAFAHSGFDLSTYDGRLAAGRAEREATVDFSKFGSAADSDLYKGATAIIPFLNAQIQGLDKTVDTLKEIKNDPYRRAVILGRMAVNSILSGAIVSGVRGLTWDDDDREAYEQLSDYEKQKFIHLFRIGNYWVKIKRSQDMFIQAADLVGEFIGQISTGYEGDAVGDLAAGAREIVKNGFISTGSVIQPVKDALNGKTWYGGDIDSYNDRQMSMTARYGADTSKLGRLISELSGGKLSPKAADYIMQQYMGSAGEFGNAIFDSVTGTVHNLSEGKNADLNPLLNWVMDDVVGGYIIDPVYSNKIASTYYTGKSNLDQFIKDCEGGKNELLKYGVTQDEADEAYNAAKAMTEKGGIIYGAGVQYKKLKTEYEKVMSDDSTMTQAEREERGREIKAEQNKVLLEANTAMGDFWNQYGYSNPVLQNVMNSLNVFTDSKAIPQEIDDFNSAPYKQSAEQAMPDSFKGDMNTTYMKRSVSVYEETGNSKALPSPFAEDGTFSYKKTEYKLSDGDYDAYLAAYKKTYREYVDGNKKWNTLSEDEKLKALDNADKKAHEAGKNAWLKKKGIIK